MKNGNYITGTLLTILLLAGCVPTRHLKGNEKLLYDVELNGIEQSDPEMIRALYRQKPNRKVPLLGWTPYLSVYYLGKSFYNPAKIERDFDKLRTKYEKKINKAGTDSSEVTDLVEKYDKKRAKLTRKKEEGNWLMRSIGEPPSIYDSTLTVETVSQIHTFLNSKGYFYNRVNAETNVKEKKVYLTLQV
ncbi:MAG TPA: POTRA domain-containing protein [Adhaeribacter sp.]|nr:POTRA domain-containing protein [Adhaeribacter sp.]